MQIINTHTHTLYVLHSKGILGLKGLKERTQQNLKDEFNMKFNFFKFVLTIGFGDQIFCLLYF